MPVWLPWVCPGDGVPPWLVGYAGFGGLIQNYNKGARVIMPAGSHLGGAMYLVVSPEIESLDEVVGKTLDMGEGIIAPTMWSQLL